MRNLTIAIGGVGQFSHCEMDGWHGRGEVLVEYGGDESIGITLLEYSAAGVQATGIEYSASC